MPPGPITVETYAEGYRRAGRRADRERQIELLGVDRRVPRPRREEAHDPRRSCTSRAGRPTPPASARCRSSSSAASTRSRRCTGRTSSSPRCASASGGRWSGCSRGGRIRSSSHGAGSRPQQVKLRLGSAASPAAVHGPSWPCPAYRPGRNGPRSRITAAMRAAPGSVPLADRRLARRMKLRRIQRHRAAERAAAAALRAQLGHSFAHRPHLPAARHRRPPRSWSGERHAWRRGRARRGGLAPGAVDRPGVRAVSGCDQADRPTRMLALRHGAPAPASDVWPPKLRRRYCACRKRRRRRLRHDGARREHARDTHQQRPADDADTQTHGSGEYSRSKTSRARK